MTSGEPVVTQALDFIDKFFEPWGSWKTLWWEGEVSDDAAFSADNALKHVANMLRRHREQADTLARQEGEALRAQSALRSLERVLGFEIDGPCPLCGGVEGCSHSLSERVHAALTTPTQAQQAGDGVLREALRDIEQRCPGGADQAALPNDAIAVEVELTWADLRKIRAALTDTSPTEEGGQ